MPPRPVPPPPPTRERLVVAMGDALQRRGLHGVGLAEVLAAAGAPKGVLYHHFPGGKTALAVAAIERAAAGVEASLDRAFADAAARGEGPLGALGAWLAAAERRLEASGFARGCPLAAVALESAPDDAAIRDALAEAFARARGRIAAALAEASAGAAGGAAGGPLGDEGASAGRGAADPEGLAALVVSAYEGALLQARVAGSLSPMRQATGALLALVRAAGATGATGTTEARA